MEDNRDVRDALAMVLEIEGFPTAIAEHGADALAQLRQGLTPCLILLDYNMPIMNGIEFREHQLADTGIADIPVVLYSGAYDLRDRVEHLRMPHVFQKPLKLETLVEIARRYC